MNRCLWKSFQISSTPTRRLFMSRTWSTGEPTCPFVFNVCLDTVVQPCTLPPGTLPRRSVHPVQLRRAYSSPPSVWGVWQYLPKRFIGEDPCPNKFPRGISWENIDLEDVPEHLPHRFWTNLEHSGRGEVRDAVADRLRRVERVSPEALEPIRDQGVQTLGRPYLRHHPPEVQ